MVKRRILGRKEQVRYYLGTYGIRSMIVPEGREFPAWRKARCCNRLTRAGESVLVVPVQSGDLVVQVIFHRHHLLDLLNQMPLGNDEAQSAFDKLRGRILETGKAFPDG